MQYLLAIDGSTKNTGWAIFKDSKLEDYGCISASSTDVIKRIQKMVEGIYQIIKKYPIDKIVIEEVRPDNTGYGVGNQHTQKVLMWLQAAFVFLFHEECPKVEIEYMYPSEWRKICGIKNGRGVKRDSAKSADILFVKETFGIEVNDDAADAIGIGYAAVNKNQVNVPSAGYFGL